MLPLPALEMAEWLHLREVVKGDKRGVFVKDAHLTGLVRYITLFLCKCGRVFFNLLPLFSSKTRENTYYENVYEGFM